MKEKLKLLLLNTVCCYVIFVLCTYICIYTFFEAQL